MRVIPALKQSGIVCLLAVAVAACQKEISSENGNVPPPSGCKLAKITYFDSSGGVNDTAGMVYTNDKITRVKFTDYYINLVYTGNRVTRINYFEATGAPYDFYDSIRYTSAGKIESLIYYATGGAVDEPSGGYVITYNADGTPARVIEKAASGTGTLEEIYYYDYTYSSQNITKMTVTDLTFQLSFVLNYTSDNNTNVFKSLPAEFIFADNIMFGISGGQFGLFSPFMFNRNSIASMQGLPVTYTKDSKGNMTELKMGGLRTATYDYQCQ